MRRLIFLLGAGIFLAIGLAKASENFERTTSGKDVTLTLSSPLSAIPPGGCVPFRLSIRNESHAPGTWTVEFVSTSYNAGTQTSTLRQSLTVAGDSTGRMALAVPLPNVALNGANRDIQASVTGPGFDQAGLSPRRFAYFSQNTSPSSSPFTLIGKDLLGPIGLGPLQTLYTGRSGQFYGSELDVEALPPDWRALSGVAALLLKDSEWLELDPARRDAVCDYVAQGGHLTLFVVDNPSIPIPRLHLPEPDGKPGPYGFGVISVVSSQTVPPDASTLHSAIENQPAAAAEEIDKGFSIWDLRLSLGTIAVNGAFILSFVLVFGSLVGPVNLYVFARGKNRFRLFWTTPLISLLASLGLTGGILLTDGLGGSGREMIAIFSLPGENREAVVQEQAARTAVLFSSAWRNAQSYLITPVSETSMSAATLHRGALAFRTVTNYSDNSSSDYFQIGDELSGSWFPTRALAGQYLQAMRPSRSSLMILNADAVARHTDAPVVLSSFPSELNQLYLRDAEGGFWTCSHLQPGRKQTCSSSNRLEYVAFWKNACRLAGGKLRPALQTAAMQPAYFYATGLPSPDETLTTLGEIRWQVASGVYLGPWVPTPTTGGEP